MQGDTQVESGKNTRPEIDGETG